MVTALNDGTADNFFTTINPNALGFFGSSAAAGSWTSQDATPRAVADIDGDGNADIVGFGSSGVVTALGNGDGTFAPATNDLAFFGSSAAGGSWTSQNATPRFLADLNHDGNADIIGFGPGGVVIPSAMVMGPLHRLRMASPFSAVPPPLVAGRARTQRRVPLQT